MRDFLAGFLILNAVSCTLLVPILLQYGEVEGALRIVVLGVILAGLGWKTARVSTGLKD
jgi:hypothetical protein